MATLLPFPRERIVRMPSVSQTPHPLVIVDTGDEELERAERFLMRGRSIENLTTGEIGKVIKCRRNGMAIEALFWSQGPNPGAPIRSNWVLADLLRPAPGNAA